VASCKVSSCKVASCKVASCMDLLHMTLCLQEGWFAACDVELKKICSFYMEKKSEALRKFNCLKVI
jgi:hypothetical protein